MKKLAFIFLLAMIVSLPCPAQALSPQQTLNQYVADLQKNPGDYALREKIIRHAQAMKPKPAVPDEARKYMDRGIAAFEGAKTEEDFRAASVEFSKAVNLAPWLGDAYRNLAIAQDKSGQYDAALINLRLYLLTFPSPADEAWAKSLINKVEYRKEKAAKESSPAAIAAKKQKEFEDWLKKIDGRRYTYRDSFERITQILDVKGRTLIRGFNVEPNSPVRGPRGYTEFKRYEIRGRVVEGPVISAPPEIISIQDIFTISEDGEKIHMECRLGRGKGREYDYYWQR